MVSMGLRASIELVPSNPRNKCIRAFQVFSRSQRESVENFYSQVSALIATPLLCSTSEGQYRYSYLLNADNSLLSQQRSCL